MVVVHVVVGEESHCGEVHPKTNGPTDRRSQKNAWTTTESLRRSGSATNFCALIEPH